MKRFTPCCDKGFTLMELMVSTTIGLVVMAIGVESTRTMRHLYLHDIVRTRINQDVRMALDLIGVNIRQAGENLTATFPAVEILDGGSGADELVLRRNLLDEVLNVCTDLAAGSSVSEVFFATAGTTPGCIYGDNTFNFTSWQTARTNDDDDQVNAYILNLTSKAGEFFSYVGETDSGASYNIIRGGGQWQNDYPTSGAAVYILEEWRFRLNGDVLELIIDQDTDNPLNVAYGLTDMQITAHLQDGTSTSDLGILDDWTEIASIEIEIDAESNFAGQTITSSLTSKFFPRNILSN